MSKQDKTTLTFPFLLISDTTQGLLLYHGKIDVDACQTHSNVLIVILNEAFLTQ